jgi:hypothetical protein
MAERHAQFGVVSFIRNKQVKAAGISNQAFEKKGGGISFVHLMP